MLEPLDSIEILAIVDNELDPISPAPPIVTASGRISDIGLTKGRQIGDEVGGGDVREIGMEQICCAAHGLSLIIVSALHPHHV